MEYEQIKNWLKDSDYQNSGLRTDKYHRIDLYLSDVLYHYSKETFQQLQTRIKELKDTTENNITEVSEFFNDGVKIFECNSCGMLMEENEPYNNYCPNCGRKIKK